ncbi:hypothetical protein [Spirosoma agri]|uniref:Uncharacterized protein n=1 Tax=Spirosoma agri TaxID=1987381 RepID=A0A6M0IIY9_9BACT|nr:hypothetical protein [Spirosoma agri]NEU68256.1 hypothetical protein [Spirosoma agri]
MNRRQLRQRLFFLEAQLVASQQTLKQLEYQKVHDLTNLSVDSYLSLSLAICDQISGYRLTNLATLSELKQISQQLRNR